MIQNWVMAFTQLEFYRAELLVSCQWASLRGIWHQMEAAGCLLPIPVDGQLSGIVALRSLPLDPLQSVAHTPFEDVWRYDSAKQYLVVK